MMCIVSQDALKKGKLLGAQQDGSREFISLLACISAAGKCLPPLLIYKGESHDIMNTWLEDFEEEDKAWFVSQNDSYSIPFQARLGPRAVFKGVMVRCWFIMYY